MAKYKTNDGAIVDTRHADAHYKGRYVGGKISETLWHDRTDGYYNVNHLDGSVEWCCPELAIEWFKRNGIWDLPKDLRGVPNNA
jgi:hypothetical protein